MARKRLGGWIANLLGLASGFGCQAQVGEDYEGEPLLSLRGSVLLSEEQVDADLEPRLMYIGRDGEAVLSRGELSGDFPAKFRYDVTEPPPESAIHAVRSDYGYAGRMAEGWLVLVPPDYPTRLPYATQTESTIDSCDADGTVCVHTERKCTEDGRCRERKLECTHEPCTVVETWGEFDLGEDVMTETRMSPDCSESGCYYVNELCDSEGCYAVVNQCDFFSASEWGETEVLFDGTMTATSCTVLSDGGSTAVTSIEDLQTFWTNHAIFYVTDDFTNHPAGPLEQGYNLMVLRPTTEWLEAVECEMKAAVESVTEYNQENGSSYTILSPEKPIRELIDEAKPACGWTYPLTRIEDPLSESLTIRIGQFPGEL